MPPVLLSAEIRASALRMSKFRGSITFPIFSLSTLSRQHYCSPPKTRYCWLVRPSQTGFSPARLPALRLGAQSRFVPLTEYHNHTLTSIKFSLNFFLPPHCRLTSKPFAGGRRRHNTKTFIYSHEQAARCQGQDHLYFQPCEAGESVCGL